MHFPLKFDCKFCLHIKKEKEKEKEKGSTHSIVGEVNRALNAVNFTTF